MNLEICSLASGSSGNCYLIRSENTAVLVDAGISCRQICLGLKDLGLGPADLAGVLITHEHSDHVKGLKVLAERHGVPVFINEATLRATDADPAKIRLRLFRSGDSFRAGDLDVKSYPVSHDAADPVAFSFEKDGAKISIVTDTGVVTGHAKEAMRGADVLVLESNHDESVLLMGRYPWFLKQRILSDIGHLSNEAAAEALSEVLLEEQTAGSAGARTVLLAHLSAENNFPEMALMTMQNILEANGFSVNRDIWIETLPRQGRSPIYSV